MFSILCLFSVLSWGKGHFWDSTSFDSDDDVDVILPNGEPGVKIRFDDGHFEVMTKPVYEAFEQDDEDHMFNFIREPSASNFQNLSTAQKVDVAEAYIRDRAMTGENGFASDYKANAEDPQLKSEHFRLGSNYFNSLSRDEQKQVALRAFENENTQFNFHEKDGDVEKLQEQFLRIQRLFTLATDPTFESQLSFVCSQLKTPKDETRYQFELSTLWRTAKLIEQSQFGAGILASTCPDPESKNEFFSVKAALQVKGDPLKRSSGIRATQISQARAGAGPTFRNSQCTPQQILKVFSPAVTDFKNYKGATYRAIVFQEGSCLVQGVALQSAEGKYSFTPRSPNPGQKLAPIPFIDAADIAKKLLN